MCIWQSENGIFMDSCYINLAKFVFFLEIVCLERGSKGVFFKRRRDDLSEQAHSNVISSIHVAATSSCVARVIQGKDDYHIFMTSCKK